MAWLMVFVTGQQKGIRRIGRRDWLFLLLSGLSTGLSWLCYYHALQIGQASRQHNATGKSGTGSQQPLPRPAKQGQQSAQPGGQTGQQCKSQR